MKSKPEPRQGIKQYLSFDEFFNQDLTCAVSTRILGNMSLVYGKTENSLKNRKVFLNKLNINPADLVAAQQVHSANVRYVSQAQKGRGALDKKTAIPATDAMITDKKKLPLGVFTADCLSVFLYDRVQGVIGIVHAGWRGSKANIIAKTLKEMNDRFGTCPDDLRVALGPLIRDCCYQVGDDFKEFFPLTTRQRGNRFYLDLASENKGQLLKLGVKIENIYDPLICCSCDQDRFFSYRQEGEKSGRIISLIMLK